MNTKSMLVLVIFSLVLLSGVADAATYYAIPPNEEVCTSVKFGNDGRGEYTLTVDEPGSGDSAWADNHYTSYLANENNIVSVPICFSSIGRSIGDEAIIRATLITPTGKTDFEYGICVSSYGDIDITKGAVDENVCEAMGEYTDIFSASFTEPRKTAVPGADVSFDLVIDSHTEMALKITKSSGDLAISASAGEVALGEEPAEVSIGMKAPSAEGEHPFSVMVYADGCTIDDCRREVDGVLVVQDATEQPQAGFMLWLTPESKSVVRDRTTQLSLLARNYGDGQEITFSIVVEDGLETGFVPYTKFIAKGGSEQVPVYLRVTAEDGERFGVTAIARGKDGTERSSKSWLIVDEMKSDAALMGSDDFVDDYGDTDVTLDEWEGLKSSSSGASSSDFNPSGFESPSQPAQLPDYLIYIVIIAVVAVVAIVGFMFYKKSQVQSDQGLTWKDLGLK